MTDSNNTTKKAESNQQNPNKKNNNYYKKSKPRPYNKPYNNQPKEQKDIKDNSASTKPSIDSKSNTSVDKKPSYNKSGYTGYKRYNKTERNIRDAVETVEDVKKDILRVEKEIRLEIEEIKMIRV